VGVGRTYGQYCPLAHALDLVGERWSLLVVRELLQEPLRYTDLAERLPGCGTNVLAARLRTLESGGVVVRRRLEPPASSTVVYELTGTGEALAPVVAAVARWGARTLGPPPVEALTPGWLERVLRLAVAPAAPDARLVFRCEGSVASLDGGDVRGGPVEDPAAEISCDARGFYRMAVDGDLDGVRIDGDRDAVERLVAALTG
jgi:DNA-binding HxlR family transcriptional regulator